MEPFQTNPPINEQINRRGELFSKILRTRGEIRKWVYDTFPSEREFTGGCLDQTNNIILILGSPRSGTSVVKSILATNREILSLPGEHRYYFTLLRKNFPDIGVFKECDNTPVEYESKTSLLESIFYETGQPFAGQLSKSIIQKYSFDWAARLIVQWPDLELDPNKIVSHVNDACSKYCKLGKDNLEYLDLLLLKEFVKLNDEINPYYYDVNQEILKENFKEFRRIVHPPGNTIIEISPFIILKPQKVRSGRDVKSKLLLKASSDPYRMDTISDLFEGYKLNIIHLTRNPLAAINGLIDGWEHNCFWQHELRSPFYLKVEDTSDFWMDWNFDLYESFNPYLKKELVDLCADQWIDSNKTIIKYLNSKNAETFLRIKFESFQLPSKRVIFFKEINDFLGIDEFFSIPSTVKQVNITAPPKTKRWQNRSNILLPLLEKIELTSLADLIGYKTAEIDSWL